MAKAQLQSVLLKVIIAVSVIVVLFYIVLALSSSASDIARDTACTTSVWMRSNVAVDLGVVRKENFLPIICPLQQIGSLEGSEEEVKKKISQMAGTCWDNYARGQVTGLFDKGFGERTCSACFMFSVEEHDINMSDLFVFMSTNMYERPGIRGGNLEDYMTGFYKFNYRFSTTSEKRINTGEFRIDRDNRYVTDYSGRLTQAQIDNITKLGDDLSDVLNLHVVIADNFDAINPRRARDIIENNGLNSAASFDAFLVMIDLKERTVLIRAGRELESHVMEQELDGFIRRRFADVNNDTFGDEVVRLIENFKDRFIPEGVNPWDYYGLQRGTYLAHLTNYGTHRPPALPDIKGDGSTYVVAYSSEAGYRLHESIIYTVSGGFAGATGMFVDIVEGIRTATPSRFLPTRGTSADWDRRTREYIAGLFTREGPGIIIVPLNEVTQQSCEMNWN